MALGMEVERPRIVRSKLLFWVDGGALSLTLNSQTQVEARCDLDQDFTEQLEDQI